jgi:O-antigen ligase
LSLGVIFVFVVYAVVRHRRHLLWLTYALVAGGVVTSLVGVLGGANGGRLSGGAGNPNELASVLVPALALAGFAFASGRSRGSRILLGASSLGILLAVLATGSRGGLVALAVAMVAAVAFGGTVRVPAVVLFVVVAGVGVGYYSFAATPVVRDRIIHFGSGGGTGRTDLWKVATAVAKDRPILGVGAGNFPIVEPAYAARTVDLPGIRFIVDTPKVTHNTFLGIQAELGAPGLILFLVLVGAAIASAVRAIRGAVVARDVELELLSRGSLVALIAFLTAAMFGSDQYGTPLWLFLGLATATSSVVSRLSRADLDSDRRGLRPLGALDARWRAVGSMGAE